MTLNKYRLSKTYLVDWFLLYWFFGLVTQTSVVQDHALDGRDNSMRASVEENPGWGVPARI